MDVSGLALRALFLAAAVHAYVSTVHAYALEHYDVILNTLKYMMNLPSASNTNHLGVQTYGALASLCCQCTISLHVLAFFMHTPCQEAWGAMLKVSSSKLR